MYQACHCAWYLLLSFLLGNQETLLDHIVGEMNGSTQTH